MEKNRYKQIVKENTPKENRLYDVMITFFVGGIMGVIGQGLLDFYSWILDISTKEAAIFMIVTLIFIGCLFTCLGFFDKWVSTCKAGLLIPITGFAHSMMSAALEYRKEGFVTGIGSNMFKLAGSVIVYGVVSAYTFGIIRYLLLGG